MGLDVDQKTNANQTILNLAMERGQKNIIELLRMCGAQEGTITTKTNKFTTTNKVNDTQTKQTRPHHTFTSITNK